MSSTIPDLFFLRVGGIPFPVFWVMSYLFKSPSSVRWGKMLKHYQIKTIVDSYSLLHLAPSLSQVRQVDFDLAHLGILEGMGPGGLTRRVLMDSVMTYRLTKLSPVEFIELYSELEMLLRSSRFGRHSLLSPSDSMLMWFLRSDGLSLDALRLMVRSDVAPSTTTIERAVDRVTDAINVCWEDELSLGSAESRRALAGWFSSCASATAVLDGTHCEISTPGDEDDEYQYYSGYKGKHTQNYLVLIDPARFFLAIDGPFPGRLNDRAAWNGSEMKRILDAELANDELILADGGFPGPGPFVLPHNKLQRDNASEEERKKMEDFNMELQLNRSSVEHQIGQLKNRTQALRGKYKRKRERQNELIKASARSLNRVRRMRLEKKLDGQSIHRRDEDGGGLRNGLEEREEENELTDGEHNEMEDVAIEGEEVDDREAEEAGSH